MNNLRLPLRTILLYIILSGILALSMVLYLGDGRRSEMKEDLIELSNIKYGLFSVDEWKRVLTDVVTKKIEAFNFEGESRQEMRRKIIDLLTRAIDEFEANFHRQNNQNLGGFLKELVAGLMGGFDSIRKDIPRFADNILDMMNDPENRNMIRGMIVRRLNEYADNTFAEIDYTRYNQILETYGQSNAAITKEWLTNELNLQARHQLPYKASLILLAMLVAALVGFGKKFTKTEFLALVLLCLALLATGVTLPMIELDARIANMSFNLFGEPVAFTDQVLFYKSKSILQVVTLMFDQQRWDVMGVGVLVLTFSVLFPVSKLLATLVYNYNDQVRGRRVFEFLVFKTGKWSMADVMVIAIFMAYIGFSGIISEQLRQIEGIALNVEMLTTNKSGLLIGFYAFTSFAVLSLLVAHRLKYND